MRHEVVLLKRFDGSNICATKRGVGFWALILPGFHQGFAMNKSAQAVGQSVPSIVDTLFEGGCTAVFLVIMANVAGAVLLYLQ